MTRSSVTTASPKRRGQRCRRLLRALQGRCGEIGDVRIGEVIGDPVGHRPTGGREPVAGQPSVEDVAGVVHLAVTEQVDDGRAHRVRPASGARRAVGTLELFQAPRAGVLTAVSPRSRCWAIRERAARLGAARPRAARPGAARARTGPPHHVDDGEQQEEHREQSGPRSGGDPRPGITGDGCLGRTGQKGWNSSVRIPCRTSSTATTAETMQATTAMTARTNDPAAPARPSVSAWAAAATAGSSGRAGSSPLSAPAPVAVTPCAWP